MNDFRRQPGHANRSCHHAGSNADFASPLFDGGKSSVVNYFPPTEENETPSQSNCPLFQCGLTSVTLDLRKANQTKPLFRNGSPSRREMPLPRDFFAGYRLFGHGTLSRSGSGKHAVLDAHPELEYLYEPSGWSYCLSKTVGESVVKSVTDSTRDKTCIVWESGWLAYISASAATTEDPTPTVKLGAGKVDKDAITLHKDYASGLSDIAVIIMSTRQELSVSRDGVGATEPGKE